MPRQAGGNPRMFEFKPPVCQPPEEALVQGGGEGRVQAESQGAPCSSTEFLHVSKSRRRCCCSSSPSSSASVLLVLPVFTPRACCRGAWKSPTASSSP